MENILDKGFRGARGRHFFIPFKDAEGKRSDFEAEPGEVSFSTGLAGNGEKGEAEHLTGECDDICVTPEPVPTVFPRILSPQIDIEGVQIKLPPGKNAWQERMHTSGTAGVTNDTYILLTKLIEGSSGGRTSQELEELKIHLREASLGYLQRLETTATEQGSLLRTATITTALRLKGGRHCQWGMPVTLKPNDGAWGVEVSHLQWASDTLQYRLTANPMPWCPAIRIPDTPANREWKKSLCSPEMEGIVEALDIFISRSSYPDVESERNSMARFGFSSGMPYIDTSRRIAYPGPEEISCWGLRIGSEWKEKEVPAVFDPGEYRLTASIPIGSLPDYDEWIEVAVDSQPEKEIATGCPDYEADIPGRGELMPESGGMIVISNPSFAIPKPAALPAEGKDIFSDSEVVREEGERSLFVSINFRGIRKWYPAESSNWRCGETPEWIFHPMAECMAIAEEKTEGEGIRHRIFPLSRLETGGTRWHGGISGIPDWEAGPFTPEEPIEDAVEEFPLKKPGRILCGDREYPGIYPSPARLSFPEEAGEIVSLIEYYGEGAAAGSLIAFAAGEIRLLTQREINTDGVALVGLSDAGLIERIGVKGYRQTVGMPSGAVFVSGGAVRKASKRGVVRLSARDRHIPDISTLRYHSFAEIIEACDSEGKTVWRYDAIKNEEMGLLPVSITDFLKQEGIELPLPEGEGLDDYKVTLVTRPFRITEAGPMAIAKSGGREGVPLLFTLYSLPAGEANSSGQEESAITGVMTTEDLRTWRVVWSRGMTVGPVLPVAAQSGFGQMRFYRFIYLSRQEDLRPQGIGVTVQG